MLKNLIVILIIIWLAMFAYKKFLAPTLKPFFNDKSDKVDMFGLTSPHRK